MPGTSKPGQEAPPTHHHGVPPSPPSELATTPAAARKTKIVRKASAQKVRSAPVAPETEWGGPEAAGDRCTPDLPGRQHCVHEAQLDFGAQCLVVIAGKRCIQHCRRGGERDQDVSSWSSLGSDAFGIAGGGGSDERAAMCLEQPYLTKN